MGIGLDEGQISCLHAHAWNSSLPEPNASLRFAEIFPFLDPGLGVMTGRFTWAMLLALLLAGCQNPSAQRQPMFDMSRAPKLFNRTASSNNSFWSRGQSNNNRWADPENQVANFDVQTRGSGGGGSQNALTERLDSDNQQLLVDLAGMKQRLEASNDYNYQLKQQLADSVTQLQQMQSEKFNLEQRLASSQINAGGLNATQAGMSGGIPSQLPGAATLRANNSLMQKINLIQLPGVTTRMDGDVIRVELPSDSLFVPGSYQINANYGQVLQQVANSIRTNFPDQIIGIEAHWDGTPINNATPHQFTATQTVSVFDYLVRAGMPEKQLFTMAMGNNRPRHTNNAPVNGLSPNRRVEIVIYPETWSGR
jgi:flagellar motor protein MotB